MPPTPTLRQQMLPPYESLLHVRQLAERHRSAFPWSQPARADGFCESFWSVNVMPPGREPRPLVVGERTTALPMLLTADKTADLRRTRRRPALPA